MDDNSVTEDDTIHHGQPPASTSATEGNGNKVLGPRPRVRPTGLHHCTGKKKQSDGLGVNMGRPHPVHSAGQTDTRNLNPSE